MARRIRRVLGRGIEILAPASHPRFVWKEDAGWKTIRATVREMIKRKEIGGWPNSGVRGHPWFARAGGGSWALVGKKRGRRLKYKELGMAVFYHQSASSGGLSPGGRKMENAPAFRGYGNFLGLPCGRIPVSVSLLGPPVIASARLCGSAVFAYG